MGSGPVHSCSGLWVGTVTGLVTQGLGPSINVAFPLTIQFRQNGNTLTGASPDGKAIVDLTLSGLSGFTPNFSGTIQFAEGAPCAPVTMRATIGVGGTGIFGNLSTLDMIGAPPGCNFGGLFHLQKQ